MMQGMRGLKGTLTTLKNLTLWRPKKPLVGKLFLLAGLALVGGAAFLLGKSVGLGSATADPVLKAGGLASKAYPDDYNARVVAYIHGNIPVTRVELAEFLIARFGKERIEFLVNRKIVERACQAKN